MEGRFHFFIDCRMFPGNPEGLNSINNGESVVPWDQSYSDKFFIFTKSRRLQKCKIIQSLNFMTGGMRDYCSTKPVILCFQQ